MSHRDREHPPGAKERGNDWLDGALAGWLLFIAISTSPYAWHALREGGGAPTVLYELAAPLLAVAAIFPLLSFRRAGWILAALVLALMVARSGMTIADTSTGWRAAAAFLLVHLAGLAYLVWIIPEFWPRHAADGGASPAQDADAAISASPAVRAEEPASTGPAPMTQALAALHHRIVAAGSACAVAPVAVRAEAGRFGVTPAALRTEGLALYRTFLDHFLDDGPLTPDEERELICLERALDLDDEGVWRLRAEAGLLGGPGTPAPILSVVREPALEAGPGRALPAGDEAQKRVEEIAADRDGALADADEAPLDAADRFALSVDADRPSSTEPIRPVAPRDGWDAADAVPPASGDGFHAADEARDAPPSAPASMPADGLADYEEHELGALLRWAGIGLLPAGASRRAALERLRALHRVLTEPLEPCPSAEPLEPGERCLAVRTVELHRAGTAPAEPLADVPGPVLDPAHLVDGALEAERALDGFQRTGLCRLVVTDRRLLLVAPSGQQSPLPLGRVRAVRPFRNGIQVQPVRGGPVFLAFADGVADVAMRMDRAARDLRPGA